MTVSEGPGMVRPEFVVGQKLDVGFRVLTTYEIGTDSFVTRFDVLLNGEIIKPGDRVSFWPGVCQFNAAINSTEPGVSSLLLPMGGILGGFVIQASSKELIGALRGLADKLEQVNA